MEMREELTHWLAGRRWFAGKGREISRLDATGIGLLGETPPVELIAVNVTYADGEHETYNVPVSYRDEPDPALAHALIGHWSREGGTPRYGYDALEDKDATNAWLTGMASGRYANGLSFQREAAATGLPTHEPSRVLGGEQSNTSLVFGDAVILKVFRRLAAGTNPDVELLHALAQAGNTAVPALLGWVDGSWPGPDESESTGTVAIATEFFPSATDGWDLALASVRALYAEDDPDPAASGGDFAGEAFRLGQATASVHADLARVLGSVSWSGPDIKTLAQTLQTRLEAAVRAAPQLAPFADEISARYAELMNHQPTLTAQRIHGDLHLGQALRTDSGWRILDFEGEPARPVAERSAPQTPLKDVAGMLRSFDYAARQLFSGADPAAATARPGAEERAAAWAARNQRAYRAGYADVAGADALTDPIPLTALVLDKAAYEVVYETRNRPGWIDVPLGAIRRLLENPVLGDVLAGGRS
ncbi:phosphotransferase [Sporichthya sp.]|uniref:maltokinase N-terminal cap-like domain-containing protein n=1 Tax=Sporichthya sp. TaxID=65475 RepID=UPI0017B6EA16|nr:phosphotransferase [Sporichthya sp.]MBA3743416.1 aminoglycoside phosphotransferase [Sporichthya sp.]